MEKPLLDKEIRKMFVRNIIKFFVWTTLLIICFAYLQKHPAEKVSVLSGFEVMWQKWQLIWHRVFYDDAELLDKRYKLQKYYKELVRTAENCKGIDVETLENLHEDYIVVKDLKGNALKYELAEYIRLVYQYEAVINQSCK